MPWPFWGTDDTADDEERDYLNNHCREGVDPRSVWDDFGDSEVDHKVEARDDVHCSTEEENEDYYNQNRPSGWWPL
ncbi:hypothetical protein IQ265_00750 [Nodosilinea sp. LEGE 06152]|uniref:hypothetical protein n=1 Tax=Nodosilinea sp. LEGE 06152 TaxID=2777966 RepID=UPI0018828526|nr:hypothetical protein [Nodosilinea sp. LEGE 06152]MBE9155376.1 hypothetical protein [Nodosilinea sp. LEGE 06152]